MGKKAREIAESGGLNVDEIIEDLNRAYCDEWIAYYYYSFAAQNAEGRAMMLSGELERIAGEELEHAEELADKISELGGEPVRGFGELEEKANCPSVDLPDDLSDTDDIAEAVIEGERCALDVYKEILDKIGSYSNAPSIYHLIRHIMDEEIEHEETFETIISR